MARHKPLDKGNIQLSPAQSNWIPQEEIPVGEKSRKDKGTEIYPYHQRTRCEEWSTLRQQLPSIGTFKIFKNFKNIFFNFKIIIN